ncbi:MAG TPA: GntR family transcriptional regulator [Bacillota bacterium]
MSMIERVYKALRKEILEGKLEPGTRMTERQLAEKFQISRTPVREALSRLRNEGLVYNSPTNGLVVSECSIADAEEIMGIRIALESYAIEQAFAHFTEMDIMHLEFFIKKAQLCAEEGDIQAVLEANTDFHNYIVKKSGNKRLKSLLSNVTDAIVRYRKATLCYPGNMQTSIENHTKIIDALKSKDKKAAKKLLVADIESAKEVLLKVIKNILEEDKAD